jgi:subtilisin family serine protease
MSIYSQMGPMWDFKTASPLLAAVGENYLSTIRVAAGSYANFRGTSMASPQVAGLAALVIEAGRRKGNKLKPAEVASRLATSARSIDSNQADGPNRTSFGSI